MVVGNATGDRGDYLIKMHQGTVPTFAKRKSQRKTFLLREKKSEATHSSSFENCPIDRHLEKGKKIYPPIFSPFPSARAFSLIAAATERKEDRKLEAETSSSNLPSEGRETRKVQFLFLSLVVITSSSFWLTRQP